VIKETADKIVQLGLDKKGYVFVNLDDCWQIDRDNTTKVIIEDKKKFPSGMPALSKYVHSKGLKFGLYSDAGSQTCQGRPGSYGFEKIDAQTYAKWE
jgi:alpha-galactosidase